MSNKADLKKIELSSNGTNAYLPLRDVVFKTLREAIFKGDLKPGERLMEVQLAEQLGVSRTPIREAIRKLELEGMAVTMPRRGAVVAKMTEKDMEDVLQIRRALDELSVTIACEQISMSQMKLLEEAQKNFEEKIEHGDMKEITNADVEFHDIIYQSTGNDRLWQIMKGFGEQMYRYRVEYLKERENYPTLVEEHRQIVEGLKRRDKHAVVEIMRRHVTNQAVEMKNIIREQEEV
ncbi:GntR family transcriptional regulator [Eubacterium oxidoreducens]|uniref:DNA-binding transcriptional regulator, GntR family n=1 Tax=Eubacterium oxidoreducens TaxID=1732 RepID=A0A1G6BBK5_EUBOX|nr:GntR family transcriptional regulator [Eubacterium oxidoreducens]SDB17978.1 DNA-binding transcriptional regulator, GntR family [Eubacterium oxidoreducens]